MSNIKQTEHEQAALRKDAFTGFIYLVDKGIMANKVKSFIYSLEPVKKIRQMQDVGAFRWALLYTLLAGQKDVVDCVFIKNSATLSYPGIITAKVARTIASSLNVNEELLTSTTIEVQDATFVQLLSSMSASLAIGQLGRSLGAAGDLAHMVSLQSVLHHRLELMDQYEGHFKDKGHACEHFETMAQTIVSDLPLSYDDNRQRRVDFFEAFRVKVLEEGLAFMGKHCPTHLPGDLLNELLKIADVDEVRKVLAKVTPKDYTTHAVKYMREYIAKQFDKIIDAIDTAHANLLIMDDIIARNENGDEAARAKVDRRFMLSGTEELVKLAVQNYPFFGSIRNALLHAVSKGTFSLAGTILRHTVFVADRSVEGLVNDRVLREMSQYNQLYPVGRDDVIADTESHTSDGAAFSDQLEITAANLVNGNMFYWKLVEDISIRQGNVMFMDTLMTKRAIEATRNVLSLSRIE